MSVPSPLLKKYNVPGPRYTSYPTVPYWENSPTEAQWVEHLDRALTENLSAGIGASIYLHIPFCQSLCTYCGCNTRITRNPEVSAPYVNDVLKEWQTYRERLGRNSRLKVSEFHLGGGTPTYLPASELKRLIGEFFSTIDVPADAELSLEADPRVTTVEQLRTLREFGFKRLSLGIQDFDVKVQEIVNRVQTEEQVRDVVEAARSLGYTSINFDLIYGLPLQTRASIEQTIQTVQRLRPDRIAFYAYAHVPWIKPGQRRFTEADLPNGEDKRALYELGLQMLESVGYREVGMDHFSLETDSLWQSAQNGQLHRNFMGYTPKLVSPQFGLGVSAIGDAWTCFAQNEKLLETYQTRVRAGELPIHRGHILTEEDLAVRRHILDLMTQFATKWAADPFLDTVPERLSELARDQLVELSAHGCQVTEQGRAFLRNVCMAFDARLVRKAPATQLFSKTV